MSQPLKTERRGRVLEVTLNRPKANAIDAATSIRMGEVFCDFRDDDSLWIKELSVRDAFRALHARRRYLC